MLNNVSTQNTHTHTHFTRCDLDVLCFMCSAHACHVHCTLALECSAYLAFSSGALNQLRSDSGGIRITWVALMDDSFVGLYKWKVPVSEQHRVLLNAMHSSNILDIQRFSAYLFSYTGGCRGPGWIHLWSDTARKYSSWKINCSHRWVPWHHSQ